MRAALARVHRPVPGIDEEILALEEIAEFVVADEIARPALEALLVLLVLATAQLDEPAGTLPGRRLRAIAGVGPDDLDQTIAELADVLVDAAQDPRPLVLV